MGTVHYGADFNRALRLLRRELPGPIHLRTVPRKWLQRGGDKDVISRCFQYDNPDEGDCFYCFGIFIARGLKELVATDALIHEWAHAHDILENGEPREHHRDSFGKWYSRAYRVVNG